MTAGMRVIRRNTVRVTRSGVTAFNRTWPCSTLKPWRAYTFRFDDRGAFVDSDVHEAHDGPAAVALAADACRFLRGQRPDWLS